MVVWGFEIGDSEALLQAVRHLRFRQFCIKIIIKGIQKSEITDCDTGGCGMWVLMFIIAKITFPLYYSWLLAIKYYRHPVDAIWFSRYVSTRKQRT